ncbi:Uncharacterized protein Rs2_37757 [Raphanus sativus]|nr:Uncharacterized protein Rs2_37757 [Raphanus sativus]
MKIPDLTRSHWHHLFPKDGEEKRSKKTQSHHRKNSQTLTPIRIPQNLAALPLPHGCTRNEKSKTETMMVIQGENQKLSLHQAFSLETLLADHLLLIAYKDRRGRTAGGFTLLIDLQPTQAVELLYLTDSLSSSQASANGVDVSPLPLHSYWTLTFSPNSAHLDRAAAKRKRLRCATTSSATDVAEAKSVGMVLSGSMIGAGGATVSSCGLNWLVDCLVSFLSSEDWAARKAAAEAFRRYTTRLSGDEQSKRLIESPQTSHPHPVEQQQLHCTTVRGEIQGKTRFKLQETPPKRAT